MKGLVLLLLPFHILEIEDAKLNTTVHQQVVAGGWYSQTFAVHAVAVETVAEAGIQSGVLVQVELEVHAGLYKQAEIFAIVVKVDAVAPVAVVHVVHNATNCQGESQMQQFSGLNAVLGKSTTGVKAEIGGTGKLRLQTGWKNLKRGYAAESA